jgi:hypothetical protein
MRVPTVWCTGVVVVFLALVVGCDGARHHRLTTPACSLSNPQGRRPAWVWESSFRAVDPAMEDELAQM